MLADSILDVENGLKTLAAKSLVDITHGWISMHCLLQQLGRQVVVQQSGEPGKRQFLVDAKEIRDVLADETGTGSVIGISFDMSKIGTFSMSKRAFEGMRNLKFLNIYNGNVSLLEDIEYLPRLRLLHWDSYPRKSFPLTFQPECLVELDMQNSKLKKLWGGIQPLPNLKKFNLSNSRNLKEIPNLSKATNLETLSLSFYKSLVVLPSSIRNLHKLERLDASGCSKLQVIPTNINLASLKHVYMSGCSRLRSFPEISRNIERFSVAGKKFKEFQITRIDLRDSDIKMIPDYVICLPHLLHLYIKKCRKLVSIQGHSPSLESIIADNFISLNSVYCSFHRRISELNFYNCLNLDEESKKGIIQQSDYNSILLPGKEIPAEFTHQTRGNFITISLAPGGEEAFSTFSRFKACLLLSPTKDPKCDIIECFLRSKEGVEIKSITESIYPSGSGGSLSKHLFMFCGNLSPVKNRCLMDVTLNEILFEFSSSKAEIMGCGVKILAEEGQSSSGIEVSYSETRSNRNHHIDGEAEAFKVSDKRGRTLRRVKRHVRLILRRVKKHVKEKK